MRGAWSFVAPPLRRRWHAAQGLGDGGAELVLLCGVDELVRAIAVDALDVLAARPRREDDRVVARYRVAHVLGEVWLPSRQAR